MAEIMFCRGTSIHDNHPRVCRVADFEEFRSAIDKARAPKKDGAGYFCGPLNGNGLRQAQGALERNWLALDLDRIDADVYPDVCMWFARFSGFGWPTHSSTPQAPRMRVVIELDRNATRAECMDVGRVLTSDMRAEFGESVLVDPSTFRAEQPVFNPPTGVTLARYEGDALQVDRYLQVAASVPVLATVGPQAPGGKVRANRNDYLSKRAYKLKRDGLEGEPLAAALLAINREDCEPPLGDVEVRGIAERKKIVPPAPQEETPEQPAQPPRELLLSLSQLRDRHDALTWTVKGIMPAESLGVIFGGSGTFKSFIALDMALHVAHGLPWLGRKTVQGPVLYLAAEGGAGLWRRIDAWHRARHLRWQDAPMYVIPVPVDLMRDAVLVTDAALSVGVTPSLAVIDTLSQTFSGEENSANEVAAYLAEIGLMLRATWQAAIAVVHHSGHQSTERPRGSSALRGNVDWMFGVFRDDTEMLATLTCEKQKDAEPFADASFALTPLELGRDEDGDPVTSLVARHLTSAEEVQKVMADEGKAGRAGKNQLLLRLLQSGIKESDLRHAFYQDCGIENPDTRRQAYHRAKAWAIKAGFFEVAEGIVITLKRSEAP